MKRVEMRADSRSEIAGDDGFVGGERNEVGEVRADIEELFAEEFAATRGLVVVGRKFSKTARLVPFRNSTRFLFASS